MVSAHVREYLESHKTGYETLAHSQAFAAREIAHTLHVPEAQFAKAVVLRADGRLVMAVLPASHKVNLHRLREELGVSHLEMASESELTALCGDCELGTFPPFGNLYGMDVWVDGNLAASREIIFNAGTHTEAVRMKYADYASLVHPHIALFAELPE
jgi:Ala-tRNA(Pro) deacylase